MKKGTGNVSITYVEARSCNLCCGGKAHILSVCVFSCLCYLARKLHLFCTVLYCHLWPVWLYRIFPHYLISGEIFRKQITEHQRCVLIFSTTFV